MRALLLVHGLVALALLGSTIHHSAACLPWLWRKPGAPRLVTLHAGLSLLLFLVAFVLGLVLYPAYKVEVRVAVLDVPRAAGGLGLSWVSRLFDVKEHLVALALPAVVGLYALGRELGIGEARERQSGLYVALSMFVSIALSVSVVIALFVVSVRAVS